MTLSPLPMRTVSFLWGFAEASFFFLVPDVWLTYLVLVHRREGYLNILFALAGALAGGAVMYVFGASSGEAARAFVDAVPAISPALIDGAQNALHTEHPLTALLAGSLSGVPYKIYAVLAGEMGLSVILFALCSAIARGVRFLLVTSLAAGIGYFLLSRVSMRAILIFNTICWMIFYSFYFIIFTQT